MTVRGRVTVGISAVAAAVALAALGVGPALAEAAPGATAAGHGAAAAPRSAIRPEVGYVLADRTSLLDRLDPATQRLLRPVTVGNAPLAMAVAPGGGWAYVTASPTSIRRVNLVTGRAGATVHIREGVYKGIDQIAFAANGATAYVIASGKVTAIRTATNKVIRQLRYTGPHFPVLLIAPRGQVGYLVNDSNGTITRLDTASSTVGLPRRIGACSQAVYSPDGATLYVLTDGGVVPVTAATGAVGPAIPGGNCTGTLVRTPGGGQIYASGTVTATRATVTRINTATDTAAWTADVATYPMAMVLSPDGKTVYVADSHHAEITPLATASGAAGRPIPERVDATQLVIAANGKTIYAARDSFLSHVVAAVSSVTGKVVRYFRPGGRPYLLASGPGGRVVYLLCLNPRGPSGWLVPVRTATNRAGRRISVSGTPGGIVFAR